MIVVPITKRTEIIISIQICLISWTNINYKENGQMQRLLANPKHQNCVSQYGEHDCNASKKKNGDYYENPSFSYFTDEVRL